MADDFELPEADILAYTLAEAVADEHGERAQEYLVRFVGEILALEPGVREHLVDAVLDDLMEEVCRQEDSRYAFATVELIRAIKASWANERG